MSLARLWRSVILRADTAIADAVVAAGCVTGYAHMLSLVSARLRWAWGRPAAVRRGRRGSRPAPAQSHDRGRASLVGRVRVGFLGNEPARRGQIARRHGAGDPLDTGVG